MSANFLSTADIDAIVGGSARRQALFTSAAGVYDSTSMTRTCQLASAIVVSAAAEGGYTLGDTTTNDTVILAAIGQFAILAYGRKGEKVPDQFAIAVNLAEGIRSGAVPIPGLDPDAQDAVGGNVFSTSTTGVTNAKVPIFTRAEQDEY